MFDRGPTCLEVEVIVASSKTVVEKVELVETCSLYDVAPDEAFHASVGLVAIPVTALAGEASTGVEGGATMVVKLQAFDQALVPPAFLALTRQ